MFGGNKEDEKYDEMLKMSQMLRGMGMQQPYQSRNIRGVDNVVMQALMAQLNRSGNMGWPGGQQIDWSFLLDAIKNIGGRNLTQLDPSKGLSPGIQTDVKKKSLKDPNKE